MLKAFPGTREAKFTHLHYFLPLTFDIFGIKQPVALEIENTEDPLLGSSSLQDETVKENFETNKI